jgi:anthranilate synthase/aminodeoxychorismate synthase-like glutamine amidotransferase
MVLIIDNYDSFTFNLVQAVQTLGESCVVYRNDQITLAQIKALKPSLILLSPGPGTPKDAGITLRVIQNLSDQFAIFGVCLGHQAIGEAFGAQVVRAPRARHGKLSAISHKGQGSFRGLKKNFKATRYHSLIIDEKSLPSCLEVTARSEDGLIMGVQHKIYSVEGVQFHPESVATEEGLKLIGNAIGRHG